jgi:AcrR family transcriptional regulator
VNDLPTKEKILLKAYELFALKGYSAVGIREIASSCEVNLAAINYHFKNKENLYREALRHSFFKSSQMIGELTQKHLQSDVSSDQRIENFFCELFDLFCKQEKELRTHFKFYLDDSLHDEDFTDEMMSENPDAQIGPPGSFAIAHFIMSQNSKIKKDDAHWFLRTIFSLVVQKSIIYTCYLRCPIRKEFFSKVMIQAELKRSISILWNSL